MIFTELNSVENFIIYKLSSTNLNMENPSPGLLKAQSPSINIQPAQLWKYKSPSELDRNTQEVLIESELKSALSRINPEIKKNPDLADEVLYKLRAILISVNQIGLVKANEEFTEWLKGEKTLPFGANNRHVPVRLIDFENLENNSFIVTNQFRVHARETKIPDVVLLINGIPVVVGEAKTPIRPAISWLDGATEIQDIYENTIPQLFVPNILSFATEGKELFYAGIRCPLEQWSPWRINTEEDAISKAIGLKEVGKELNDLLSPKRLLDILQNFAIFTSNKTKKRIKVVCRYQQYEGANLIVERVKYGVDKKGLIWHFQGSGKSLLMVFAANLTDEQADQLSKKAAKMSAFLKSPERIQKIAEDISKHFHTKVEPHGFKAMVVTPDREACELYEIALQKYFNEDETLVVISTTANDPEKFKKKYELDKDALEKKIEDFNNPNSNLKILIVTAKLLTGFDSPILQTMYLDKSLKDHTLLQAICRTNRLIHIRHLEK